MKNIKNLKIKIFSDGANLDEMIDMNKKDIIHGMTTNPSLMKKAGIKDYKQFAKNVLKEIKIKPISFEVFSDDFSEMEKQAYEISSWAQNVYVKIPITNTKKESSLPLIKSLAKKDIKLNITAIMTLAQVKSVISALNVNTPSIVSVFAGRVADTGQDPIPLMKESLKIMKANSQSELLWASSRELLNIFQANDIGCHIITVTKEILSKLKYVNYDLSEYSLDTVKGFYKDAVDAKFKI